MAYEKRRITKAAKISDAQSRKLIEAFCHGISSSDASKFALVSRQTASKYYREFRRRIVEDKIVNRGAWGDHPIEKPDADTWVSLYRCIYKCPMTFTAKEMKYVTNKNSRGSALRRYEIRERVVCKEGCTWRLEATMFPRHMWYLLYEFRWNTRNFNKNDFRDIFYHILFLANHRNELDNNFGYISEHELYVSIIKSFENNTEFLTK